MESFDHSMVKFCCKDLRGVDIGEGCTVLLWLLLLDRGDWCRDDSDNMERLLPCFCRLLLPGPGDLCNDDIDKMDRVLLSFCNFAVVIMSP